MADTVKGALQELLRQYQDDAQIDALREGVRLLAEALMELEVREQVGAERYERTPGAENLPDRVQGTALGPGTQSQQAPLAMCGDAECEAKGHLVRALVAVLEPLVRQLQHVSSAIEHAIAIHADGPTLMSFPRAGRINAAQSFRNSATIAGGSRRSNTSPLKRESLPSPRPRGSTER